ncbi:aldo/keto reductase [Halalkalibacter nanhaiisediminis]|uniref:Putative oxidoreductase n=1 Tax=Halalkalibacter nanhaiisediminis TaxID=688079 RepID=A0A562Q883_9BACI|nr:aldo/keto reductase family oxidoreductase [Halalkalibacter nanhaiisediminis]TWI52904.1 putative oxidoreductase [Halalkalibacter nanhaiisediminis]
MERIQLASDLTFSRLVHGLWRLSEWNQTKHETLELIKFALDQGITTFDHADIYGSYTCEERFGEALALEPSLRDKIEIVTKCGIVLKSPNRPAHKSHHYNTTKAHIIASAEQSLKSLQTDYIDVLLIHRPDPLMNPEEVAEAFRELKAAGKVRYFGVSNFKHHQLTMLQSYLDEKLVTNQVELSPYELENIDDGTLNTCLEHRMPPMAWSPLAGGKLFTNQNEKSERIRAALEQVKDEIGASSIDEVAYAWLLRHPAKVMPIIGSSQADRIMRAVAALDHQMSLDQWFSILHSSMGHDVP